MPQPPHGGLVAVEDRGTLDVLLMRVGIPVTMLLAAAGDGDPVVR